MFFILPLIMFVSNVLQCFAASVGIVVISMISLLVSFCGITVLNW